MIQVYSKSGCVQCNATYRALEDKGVVYDVVDMSEDAQALQKVKDLGYSQAPVVITAEGEHWSGFRPDKIDSLAKSLVN